MPQKPNDKPTPVRLGDLKPELQKEAHELERSMNWLIKKILRSHIEKRKKNKHLFPKKQSSFEEG